MKLINSNITSKAVEASNLLSFEKELKSGTQSSKESFLDYLKESIQSVNNAQVTADNMTMSVATGKSQNIHEAMLATSQAEIGFNFMVQIRNKVLDAYQEVMRMPV